MLSENWSIPRKHASAPALSVYGVSQSAPKHVLTGKTASAKWGQTLCNLHRVWENVSNWHNRLEIMILRRVVVDFRPINMKESIFYTVASRSKLYNNSSIRNEYFLSKRTKSSIRSSLVRWKPIQYLMHPEQTAGRCHRSLVIIRKISLMLDCYLLDAIESFQPTTRCTLMVLSRYTLISALLYYARIGLGEWGEDGFM